MINEYFLLLGRIDGVSHFDPAATPRTAFTLTFRFVNASIVTFLFVILPSRFLYKIEHLMKFKKNTMKIWLLQ